MGLELVTAHWGEDHVTPEQIADLQAGEIGTGCYVFPIGEQCRAEAVTSNMVRIFDGTGIAYGRQFHIGEGEYENVTIENGTAGLLRNDFIILKYKKDEAKGVEGITFEVLKGASAETAVDPAPNNVDIRTGVFESEIPLYRVRLNGLAIEAIEPLFYVPSTKEALSKKCVELENKVAELNSKLKSGYSDMKLVNAREIHILHVEFETPFIAAPRVVCSPLYWALEYIRPLTFAISEVTSTGFDMVVCSDNEESAGVNFGFYWIAIAR